MENNLICGIYKITSPTGRIYVGQSNDVEKRFRYYTNLSCKWQPYLYNSLKKHGVKNHKFEIIHRCFESELDELESYYINLFNCFNSDHGMNLRSGGGRGEKLSDKSKIKSGESQKLNWVKRKANGTHRQSLETISKRAASYKETHKKKKEMGLVEKYSDERRKKIAEKSKEYQRRIKESPDYYSAEQIQKRKEIARRAYLTFVEKGKKRTKSPTFDISGKNNPFYGKKHTKETLEKIQQKRKPTWEKKIADGWKQSEEHISKRVQKQLGKKRTPEQIAAMKKILEERKVAGYYEKNKNRLSEIQKLAWQKRKDNGFYSDEEIAKRTVIANKIWAKRRQKASTV